MFVAFTHLALHGSKKYTSAVAQQMIDTGVVLLGKTKLPEFGLTATTEYSKAEPAHNPWNPGHSTGGSSGGSAALVAAGVVPIAHANDGGGSIRIPAACCGLVGLKPSRGRLLMNEMAKSLPINIVSDGIVSRSVRDTAAFFALAEEHYKNPALPPLGHITAPGRKRLKIGMFTQNWAMKYRKSRYQSTPSLQMTSCCTGACWLRPLLTLASWQWTVKWTQGNLNPSPMAWPNTLQAIC